MPRDVIELTNLSAGKMLNYETVVGEKLHWSSKWQTFNLKTRWNHLACFVLPLFYGTFKYEI